jgi:hypothetical protein
VPDKLQTTVAEIVNGEVFSEPDVDNRIKQIKRLMRNLKHAYPKELNYKSYSDLRSF